MTAPANQLGILCHVYNNTGTYGSPTWSAVDGISEMSIKPSWDEAEGSTRQSRVKRVLKTIMALAISGKLKVDSTDTNGYLAFLAALHSDSVLDLMILDGPSSVNGVTGYRADWQVFEGEEDQGLNTVLWMGFTLKPALTANPVSSVLITTGAPVFTSM